MRERWRAVRSITDLEASSSGRVRRASDGHLYSICTVDRYARVFVVRDGRRRSLYVHRLVAEAHLRSPVGDEEVNHKNGCKHDNSLSNLEWTTHKGNMQHAARSGLLNPPRGTRSATCRLTAKQVVRLRALWNSCPRRHTLASLARLFGASPSTIYFAATCKSWKHVKSTA